ncbi:unnamed protein product [Parajaminaea phylloscopi]
MDSIEEPKAERILFIPTEQGDVPIDLADLPVDPEGISDIVGLLSADAQPAHYWAVLAHEYLKNNGNETAALEFLARGSQVLRQHPARAHGTALLDSMLAAYYANKARSSPKQILPEARYQPLQGKDGIQTKQSYYLHATQYTNAAAAADPRSVPSQLSRAIDMALKGATPDAERIFTDVAARQPHNILALLGKACCLLRRRLFAQALGIYQQALALVIRYENKGDFSRPDPRIGVGLCLAGLNRITDARRAWTRSAQLYPQTSAPLLLLGLSALNAARQPSLLPLGLFGAGINVTDQQARQNAHEEALKYLQAAWRLNNKNAMTAAALSTHFAQRAWSLASDDGEKAKATSQFQQALKLAEHAIQYADARSDLIAATASIARAAHLAMFAATQSLCSLDEAEMQSVANRNWTRVVEDLAKAPLPGTANASLAPLPALASLSLSQLQVGQGEVVAAMHTLDSLRTASHPQLPSVLLEAAMLEASLRSASHPGAGKDELARDRHKARVLLERALCLSDAAHGLLKGSSAAQGKKSLQRSQRALIAENISKSAARSLYKLGQDALVHVELAQMLQSGPSSGDLPRAARQYTTALELLSSAQRRDGGSSLRAPPSVEIRLRANLGAVLGIRALESSIGPGYGNLEEESANVPQHPLIERSLEHLRVALDLIRAADGEADGSQTAKSPENLEFEKTTVMFNAARLQESSASTAAQEDARRAYETILQIHPEYVDARARLAIMVASLAPSDNHQGRATQLANAYFKEALSSDPCNLDTRASYVCFLAGELGSSPFPGQWGIIKDTLAELFLGPNDSKAVRIFDGATSARQVAEAAAQDPFIMSAMGCAYYQLGREARDKKERERCIFRSGEFFSQALANDRRCAVAAQGLGILLCDDGLTGTKIGATDPEAEREARKKSVDEALSTFIKLREIRDDGSIHVCLGHALGRREEWERSAKSYELASKQYYFDRNPQVLTSWSFAEYHLGMTTRSFITLRRSIEKLGQARVLFEAQRDEGSGESSNGHSEQGAASKHMRPRALHLEAEIRYNRYNEAVMKQKALQMLLETRKEERSLDELRAAAKGIDEGLESFRDLMPAAQAGQLNVVSAELLEQRIQFGESLRDRQVPSHIDDQESFEREVAEKSEAVKALRIERDRARREAEEKAAEEERVRMEEIREMRRRAIEEAREFQYRIPSPEPAPAKKSRSKGQGGAKKKNRKRGASSEVETDEEEREANERVLSDDEELAVLTDEGDDEGADFVGEDGVVDEVARAQAKERRLADKKRRKMEELRANRAAAGKKQSGKSGNGTKKKRVRGGAKGKTSRRKKAAVDSDSESSARETDVEAEADGDDAEDEAPKRRKKRAKVVDDDLIDTDEEV